jgi:ABC-type multidrug transport system permease subunit
VREALRYEFPPPEHKHLLGPFTTGQIVITLVTLLVAVFGIALADTARNCFVVLLMVAVGYAVGFRFHAGPAAALAALVLPLAVGYLLSWISALIGLTVRDPETAGTASLLPVIPLAFTSSTFVPVATMPDWLQAWANSNPITHAVDATRALALGGPTSGPLLRAVVCILGILAVVIPLAVHRYRHVTQ